MRSRTGPRLLLSDRNAVHVLERARVYVDSSRVVYAMAEDGNDKIFNLPYANVAVLFLGQGTSLTSEAARLLAEEGVYVAFTGTGGTPLHYGSLTVYQPTRYMHRMYPVAINETASLAAAKQVMEMRVQAIETIMPRVGERLGLHLDTVFLGRLAVQFRSKVGEAADLPQLLAREAQLAKQLYRTCALSAGLESFSRLPQEDDRSTRQGVVNARIDHGNYLAYGIAGAALWVLGIPQSLSVFHGKTRAGGLVFDVADSFKDAIVLPCAFANHAGEQEFRGTFIDALQNHDLLKRTLKVIRDMIGTGEVALGSSLENF